MLASVLSSTVESVSDYYVTARVCGERMPPKHAVNRGVAAEGVASVMSSLLGAGHATTSYSATIGMIQITGVSV